MNHFRDDGATPADVAAERADYEPFTQAVRELVDATLRTRLRGDDLARVGEQVRALTEELGRDGLDGPFGVRFDTEGRGRNWGNAVVGVRNPVAPPLLTHFDGERLWSDFTIGAAYEGPPGLAHGGVVSLILDQMLGEIASRSGKPGMTGTLTIRFLAGTPLGDLRSESWIDRTEGYKTFASGHILGPDGPTATAEGVFVQPKWARDKPGYRPKPVEPSTERA